MSCPLCRKCDWLNFPGNESCYDLQCSECKSYWQVKAKKNLKPSRATKHLKVLGTTYKTTLDSIGYVNYILFSYTELRLIRNIYIIKASDMSADVLIPMATSKLCRIHFKKGTYRKIRMLWIRNGLTSNLCIGNFSIKNVRKFLICCILQLCFHRVYDLSWFCFHRSTRTSDRFHTIHITYRIITDATTVIIVPCAYIQVLLGSSQLKSRNMDSVGWFWRNTEDICMSRFLDWHGFHFFWLKNTSHFIHYEFVLYKTDM